MYIADIRSRIEDITNAKILNFNDSLIGHTKTGIIKLESGKKLFYKKEQGFKDILLKEAHGLDELRKTQTVNVPQIIYVDSDILVAEYLENYSGPNSDLFHFELGKQLAKMHKINKPYFGFSEDNYIGPNPQINTSTYPNEKDNNTWYHFFMKFRLKFQLKLADENGYLSKELENLFESCKPLIKESLLSVSEGPSLLHGDLWNGNYITTPNGSYIIDPAVYYGHRETDLAMTSLFGQFPLSFYEGYNKEFPLGEGYSLREKIYQLYHLLNHLNLFGTSYYSSVTRVLRAMIPNN